MPRPQSAILLLWATWGIAWLIAAGWSRPVDKRLDIKRQLLYRALMIAGGVILAVPAHGHVGPLRLWSLSRNGAWACVVAIAAGLAFSGWARLHLGELWSGHITTKKDHRIVDTGPYGIVRHPIYTGLLLAVWATATDKGTTGGLVGAFIVTLGVVMKARLEEVWLSQELGAEAYASYRRRVPMLLPFGPLG